jgi:arylsulfatase A-like enzyme
MRFGAKVLTLELPAGRRMTWSVHLGQKPYLSIIPLTTSRADCRVRYRVSVHVDDVEQDILDHESASATSDFFGPATIEVPLDAFAGRDIDLVAEASAQGTGCAETSLVAWGSPAIYSKSTSRLPYRPSKRPNVVLIGVDTLRADHLGVYGRTPSVTPSLDRLAAESDVWLQAFSVFNVTNPSFASIMTGLYGKNHGVYDLRTPLPDEHETLAELFQEAGYRTHAVLSATHLGNNPSGLGQGFEELRLPWGQFTAELAVDQAVEWVQEVDGPFFLWLHLFDPHTPHTPPAPYSLGQRPDGDTGMAPVEKWTDFRPPGPLEFEEKRLGGQHDLYTGEVAYLDRHIGRLMGFLESNGLLDDTLVALVADHGENLGEQGVLYRHAGLWDATVHVPLMIRWPSPAGPEPRGRRIDGLVQSIDLFPTLLGACDLPVPAVDGKDLRQLTADGSHGRRVVFAEATDARAQMVRSREHLLMRISGDHFIFKQKAFLFDLVADPEQKKNLTGELPDIEANLGLLLDRWLADRRNQTEAESMELTPEQVDRLLALGYIDP